MTTSETVERQHLWLSWLDADWPTIRAEVLKMMSETGMSQDDLAYELRRAGYPVSHGSISNWLGPRGKRPVNMEALQALATVCARVSVGDWAKGRYLSAGASADIQVRHPGDSDHSRNGGRMTRSARRVKTSSRRILAPRPAAIADSPQVA